MDTPVMFIWLLFHLFVFGSLQYGNFSSSTILNPVLAVSAEVTVIITQGVHLPEQVTLSISTSSSLICPTGRLPLNSIGGYQQSITSSNGPSDTSILNCEDSLDNSHGDVQGASHTNSTFQLAFHATNNTSLTITVQEQPGLSNFNLPRGRTNTTGNTTRWDDYPRSPQLQQQQQPDVGQRWMAHQRRRAREEKRKDGPRKDEASPRTWPKAKPLPRAGTAAVVGSAFCLITLEADRRRKRQKTQEPEAPPPRREKATYDMIGQTELPVSQEQLVAEVKGIYAGLVMAEAKCIEADRKTDVVPSSESQDTLNNDQWKALIALHRCLLHEHYDFFLASQHPSASPALQRLASKYAMPARLWRHGIYSFLELLRHRLPHSLDHMLAFIYMAYSMMTLFYETVPAFEDTWIECLGDLAIYRMAIEDNDTQDRKIWTDVARHWYSKASQKLPTSGRIYYYLANLARPSALKQLSLYTKSLCTTVPLHSARASILTLFDPVLAASNDPMPEYTEIPALALAFVKVHGLMFTDPHSNSFEPVCQEFLTLLENQIARVDKKSSKDGYRIAIANSGAMLCYGSSDNPIMTALKIQVGESGHSPEEILCRKSFQAARQLAYATLNIFLLRRDDPYVLPGIHASLVFMHHMACHAQTLNLTETDFPWVSLVDSLNHLLEDYGASSGMIERDDFPTTEAADARPLAEDFALRGLLWAESYFPIDWFSGRTEEEFDDHEVSSPSMMTEERKGRILWLAARIAQGHTPLQYESASFDPIHSRINKPRFVYIASFSSDDSLHDPGVYKMASKINGTDDCLFPELNNDRHLNSIQSTLGLPCDYLKEPAQGSVSASKTVFERSSSPNKEAHDSLEDWLSDLINVDMSLDENDEVGETQGTEINNAAARTGKNWHLPLHDMVPVDLIVFSHTGDSQENDKCLDRIAESNSEHGINDQPEQQDPEEEENNHPISSQSKLGTRLQTSLPAHGKEIPMPELLTKWIDPRTLCDLSQAKSSPHLLSPPCSSSSSPPSLKMSHACYHCQKTFSRASDMKFVHPLF
ncbi:hypothetical protein BKA65DRAFT_552822 [Rhexocercosporidium sp. MPI-PUGE-AT-0058]|nr:hypothetical protein BKA65DRAFT_552822 [Rhexocercosporidium sp. MPI-PUGE-AT-0058]